LPDDGMTKDLDTTINSTRHVEIFDDMMLESIDEKPSSLSQEDLERAGSDDLNWLDQIASGEGAAIEEPPTMSWDQEESDEIIVDDSAFNEEPSWLTEVETSPKVSVEGGNFNSSDQSLEYLAGPESDIGMPGIDLDDVDGNFSDISTEVPDDPDEAMAWLEQLAARQGASLDELPTVIESTESSFEQIPSVQEITPVGDHPKAVTFEDTGLIGLENEAPDDPDEAMEWLERLASQQGAMDEELPSMLDDVKAKDDKVVDQYIGDRDEELEKALAELDDIEMPEDPEEAMVWLNELAGVTESESISEVDELGMETVEEPLTPESPHDVMKARVEAEEMLMGQPEIFTAEDSAGPAGSNIEEEEALAWLDQLANHQSIALEEADSVSGYNDDEISDSLRSDDTSAAFVKAMNMAEEVDAISDTSQTGAGVIDDELARAELGTESSFGEEIEDEELDLPRTGMTKEFAKQDVSESLPDWLALEHQEDSLEDMADDSPENSARGSDKNELAWLDSLGELNAIESLESPDEVLEAEFIEPVPQAELPPTAILQTEDDVSDSEAIRAALEDLETIPGDHAGEINQERLQNARIAVEVGNVDSAVGEYSVLVDDGEGLPFLIADLESAVHEHEGEALLQRVLGDAYVRNGQIHKALETYRQALDHL
jgi:tetratricopeptide (TPR) repeat protein